MKVLKFGGTSVGSANRIREVSEIIKNEEGNKIIVLSAMSGVTNHLVQISEFFKGKNTPEAVSLIEELKTKHLDLINELIPSENFEVKDQVLRLFENLLEILYEDYSEISEARILTFGESVLTLIVSHYFESQGLSNCLLDAKKFMQVPNLENPDTDKVGRLLDQYLKNKPETNIYITQG
ncbi:MAG TPA: hypothetical protein VLN72_02275, partial [Gillisia sp.]|nr:hypothetical protein [Gillisia sp.]